MEMEIFGIDFGCAFGSLSNGKFPEKDCLLPLISKILGYCIVAASTTVKVPQVIEFFFYLFCENQIKNPRLNGYLFIQKMELNYTIS